MELTVLGAGPAYTDRLGAAGAAYLVRSGDSAILLDLGHGAFPRLLSTVAPASLGAVLVSHLHPDHFIDLVPLRHYLRYRWTPPRRVRVVGPAGLRDRLDALHGEPGFCAEALDIEAFPAVPGVLRVEAFEVAVVPVTHSGDSVAFRVATDGGVGVVYSGDCSEIDDLVPLVRAGDTLLVEVSFGQGPVPSGAMHLDAAMVAELVRRTGPGRVLLTHVLAGSDRRATVERVQDGYPGIVELVDPGFRAVI